jgi:hypothetical protein
MLIFLYHPPRRTKNMRIAITVLAVAVTLVQPALSVPAGKSTDARAKPTSFVPHSHSNTHVYGSPIQPAIVGHTKTFHQSRTPKKKPSSVAHRNPR